nr:uncharacterized protein LOC109158070 [Ipomoea trifida]
MFSNVFFIIPRPVWVLPISAITSANSTTVSTIFLKTEVTFLKDSSDNSSRTFLVIFSGFRDDKSSRKCFVDIRLTYLDRLEFKGRKIQRTTPAITAWTEEQVKERIKSEIFSGQFGRGKVISRFERKEEQVPEKITKNVRDELSDESLRKVTSVLRKMADTVLEFADRRG